MKLAKLIEKEKKKKGEQQSIESIKAANTNLFTYYVERDRYSAEEGTYEPHRNLVHCEVLIKR